MFQTEPQPRVYYCACVHIDSNEAQVTGGEYLCSLSFNDWVCYRDSFELRPFIVTQDQQNQFALLLQTPLNL